MLTHTREWHDQQYHQRMQDARNGNPFHDFEAYKAATSILRDWDNPNSWSTKLLKADALNLIETNACEDLNLVQRIKLICIARGVEPRPEKI